jgi:type I restriction enzyme R subunit
MDIALEVSYFKAVKASMIKLDTKQLGKKKSKKEMESRVNQMLERSIISEEVIDVFDTLGLNSEVNILSEEFLEDVRAMKEKNLAVEMLKKLLEGNLKVLEKTNLVKSEKYSEKLKKA